MFVTIICILVVAYAISGKDTSNLLEKLKNVDWKKEATNIFGKIGVYAKKAGRAATKPLLQLYYVLTMGETTTMEKALICGALLFTVLPSNVIPLKANKTLALLCDGAAVVFVVNKVRNKITPEIEGKVDETLVQWFGDEDTEVVP